MSSTVKTTQDVVSRALYISGIVARDFEIPTASQINDGIIEINNVLSQQNSNMGLNPYYDTYNFNTSIGVESYFIPNLIQPETITYELNSLRYSLTWLNRDKYFGSGRINNLETLPALWFSEPTFGGATLYVYPLPNVAYAFQMHAKFRMQFVTQFQDLSLTLDQNLIDYLTFRVAQRLCAIQGFVCPDNVKQLLNEAESYIRSLIAPPDYAMRRKSTLARQYRGGVPNPALSQMFTGWYP
jgi:hypothetical protein